MKIATLLTFAIIMICAATASHGEGNPFEGTRAGVITGDPKTTLVLNFEKDSYILVELIGDQPAPAGEKDKPFFPLSIVHRGRIVVQGAVIKFEETIPGMETKSEREFQWKVENGLLILWAEKGDEKVIYLFLKAREGG